jgi:hypothetical protein
MCDGTLRDKETIVPFREVQFRCSSFPFQGGLVGCYSAVGLERKIGVRAWLGFACAAGASVLCVLPRKGDAKLEDEEATEGLRVTLAWGGGVAYRGKDSSGFWRMKPERWNTLVNRNHSMRNGNDKPRSPAAFSPCRPNPYPAFSVLLQVPNSAVSGRSFSSEKARAT